LEELAISLVVTTYQACKVVFLRSEQGQLNTHFRDLPAPMGIGLCGDRLAVGGPSAICEYRNVPGLGRRLDPAGRHDAVFVPGSIHITGDIQIHEMAWGNDELWFVNTRFSCLCTRDASYSFVPRWRPPFVTELAPEDRCHLSGLALGDGQPRYVTALGATDITGGWRENKANGGVLVDVPSGETVLNGLSMPHSPRWHDGQLWLLESGRGTLGVVDLHNGRYLPVAELPGFTRGLDFFGPLAFVGLSQVRESALFSGLPITEPSRERCCGVWVVDTRSGQTVAFVRFVDQLQEIFGVQVLPGIRYPELLNDWNHQLVRDSFVLSEERFTCTRTQAS
jgi:uncharacterized protein (TIGR03032 family)